MPNLLTFEELCEPKNYSQYLLPDTVVNLRLNKVTIDGVEYATGNNNNFLQNIREDCNAAEDLYIRLQLRRMGLYGFFWLYWREKVAQEGVSRKEKNFFSTYKADFVKSFSTESNILAQYINCQALFCADLSGSNLKGLDFGRADLQFSNLSKCDFTDSNFYRANFQNSDVSKSDFSNCMTRDTDFRNANLSGAKLETVTVDDFKSIKLQGADLSGAEFKHEQILELYNANKDKAPLYGVIFDKEQLPASYAKKPTEKQALEHCIRESYENAKDEQGNPFYNSTFLKLIQASGYSPLDWGKDPKVFQAKHDALVKEDNDGTLQQRIFNQIKDMVNDQNLHGYTQARTSSLLIAPFKIWSQKQDRGSQIEALRDLVGGKSPKQLFELAEGLLKVGDKIRLENNVFYSELRRQIEQISSSNPNEYPKAEFKLKH